MNYINKGTFFFTCDLSNKNIDNKIEDLTVINYYDKSIYQFLNNYSFRFNNPSNNKRKLNKKPLKRLRNVKYFIDFGLRVVTPKNILEFSGSDFIELEIDHNKYKTRIKIKPKINTLNLINEDFFND